MNNFNQNNTDRRNNNSYRGRNSDRGRFGFRNQDRAEMFSATCDECGKDCQVPFKPSQGKPVYCSNCFEKKGGRDRNNFKRRDFQGGGYQERSFGRSQMHQAVCDECGKNCEVPFRPTEGKPIYCSQCFENRDNGKKSWSKPTGDNATKKLMEQLTVVNSKLDQIITILKPNISPKIIREEKAVLEEKTDKKIEKEIVKKETKRKKSKSKEKNPPVSEAKI